MFFVLLAKEHDAMPTGFPIEMRPADGNECPPGWVEMSQEQALEAKAQLQNEAHAVHLAQSIKRVQSLAARRIDSLVKMVLARGFAIESMPVNDDDLDANRVSMSPAAQTTMARYAKTNSAVYWPNKNDTAVFEFSAKEANSLAREILDFIDDLIDRSRRAKRLILDADGADAVRAILLKFEDATKVE